VALVLDRQQVPDDEHPTVDDQQGTTEITTRNAETGASAA
jgi:hypothetical protein